MFLENAVTQQIGIWRTNRKSIVGDGFPVPPQTSLWIPGDGKPVPYERMTRNSQKFDTVREMRTPPGTT